MCNGEAFSSSLAATTTKSNGGGFLIDLLAEFDVTTSVDFVEFDIRDLRAADDAVVVVVWPPAALTLLGS